MDDMITLSGESGEESYVGVADEDTLQAVFEIFKAKLRDEYIIADKEDE